MKIKARFLSLARSKLRLCSANNRAGYLSNLACDWLSIVWAYRLQARDRKPWWNGEPTTGVEWKWLFSLSYFGDLDSLYSNTYRHICIYIFIFIYIYIYFINHVSDQYYKSHSTTSTQKHWSSERNFRGIPTPQQIMITFKTVVAWIDLFPFKL